MKEPFWFLTLLWKIYFSPKTICKNLWCGAITGKGRPGPAYSCLLVFGTKPNNVRHSEYMPSASYLDVTLTNTPLYSFLAGISVVKDRTLPLWNLKFLPNCCLFTRRSGFCGLEQNSTSRLEPSKQFGISFFYHDIILNLIIQCCFWLENLQITKFPLILIKERH